jgi:hypothetical protein
LTGQERRAHHTRGEEEGEGDNNSVELHDCLENKWLSESLIRPFEGEQSTGAKDVECWASTFVLEEYSI